MTIKPVDIVVMNTSIAIKWESGLESFIDNKKLREACPCANCSGETDVFGNIYKNDQPLNINDDTKYKIISYSYIGHYAIRIQWGDGHNSGIYTFDLLNDFNVK